MATADISNELSSLPLDYIISAPMLATIRSQAASSKTTYDFIKEVGFTKQDNQNTTEVQMVDFLLGSKMNAEKLGMPSKISVPMLSMVQVPFLRVDELKINFKFNIKTTQVDHSEVTTNTNFSMSEQSFFFLPKISVKGNVHTVNSHDSSVEKNALMDISVTAKQDNAPAGLMKVLGLFETLIDKEMDMFTGKKSDSSKDDKPTPPSSGSSTKTSKDDDTDTSQDNNDLDDDF